MMDNTLSFLISLAHLNWLTLLVIVVILFQLLKVHHIESMFVVYTHKFLHHLCVSSRLILIFQTYQFLYSSGAYQLIREIVQPLLGRIFR